MATISLPVALAAKKVALYQLLLLLPVAAALLTSGPVLAYSVLLGGVIQIGPQVWFARQAFRFVGARQVHSIVRAMYWGETGKVVLTAALFACVFIAVAPLHVGALFCSFAIMILAQSLIVFMLLKH